MIYLLDTDTCIDVLRGVPGVLEQLLDRSPDDCAVSSVTVFELMAGAMGSAAPDRERTKVVRFLSHLAVLPFDEAAAGDAGALRAHLKRNGLAMGPYDLLIASHARQARLRLVTRNVREFSRVPDLQLESWAGSRPSST